jgi:thiosulfate reductase/polysulfide reductase chain A
MKISSLPQDGMTRVKKSVCVWCKGECGVLVQVKDHHLVDVTEDLEWPRKVWPPARACIRLKAAKEYFYHPERVNFPLKRLGGRGNGRWQQVSWEEALDDIALRMQKIGQEYGWEAISWSRGTGYRTDPDLQSRFFRCIGAPNNCSQGQICYLPRSKVASTMAGYFPHYSVRPSTKCIVLLGAEPFVARPITAASILEARRNGAKLIVIDPRKTRSAEMADIWLVPRPGTDVALLMGMINVIITEGLYEKDFVQDWCHGFEQLCQRMVDYSPEIVAAITLVPVEKIREAARLYAQTRPGCFVEGMGVEHSQGVAEVLQARWILAGITANIDVEGGEEQVGPHPNILAGYEVAPVVRPPVNMKQPIGDSRFRLLTRPAAELMDECAQRVWGKRFAPHVAAHAPSVYRAIISGEPYPVKAMFAFGANPMITQANTKLVYEAHKQLDLVVVADMFMTPTAELADYVLPAACWLERPILWDFSGHSDYMIAGEAALPVSVLGEYDHRMDYDIYRELALRLGKSEYWPWPSLENYFDDLLAPTGLSHHEYVQQRRCELKQQKYQKYLKKGFATPTGKVELYSTIFETLGYNPLPAYHEPAETPLSSPHLAQKYPLMLTTGGRIRQYFHSEWRQIGSVRQDRPDPIVQINPDTAISLGISDGDWVWIETLRGRVKQRAQLFPGMKPDVVHAEHGWWYPEMSAGDPSLHGVWESNINVLLNDDPEVCNPVTGGWPLKTALCRIYRVHDQRRPIDVINEISA